MDVIFLSPGYPPEIPHFVQALAGQGARVWGVGDVPEHQLPDVTRRALAGYLRVPSLQDDMGVVGALGKWMTGRRPERVIALWEPAVVLAARIREAMGIAGQDIEQATRFRDKDVMKQAVRAKGIRCARSARANTVREVWAAVEQTGFPAIVKPLDGAGSMDTFRVNAPRELEAALARLTHVPSVNVEEFIDGEEYHFDTICSNGTIHYENMGFYRPKPLIARSNEWISPQTIGVRDLTQPHLQPGIALGRAVLEALEFQTGFTHMEWFRLPDGEAVFSEIAARPPGANTVDLMNFVGDISVFDGYAEAEIKGTFSQSLERKYNAVNIFKRAQGQGRITRIEGLPGLLQRYGEHVVHIDLLPLGAQRRNWVQTLLSDGYVVIRHPEWDRALEIADAFGTDLQLYAG